MVVEWSACLPSSPKIRVRILLMPIGFYVKIVFEKNENKQKRGWGWPILLKR